MNALDVTKHYDYSQQASLQEAISRLQQIKKDSESGNPYMSKLKSSKQSIYNNIGELKRKETDTLKLLEKYLKADKMHSHKKDLGKIKNALQHNKEYLSW